MITFKEIGISESDLHIIQCNLTREIIVIRYEIYNKIIIKSIPDSSISNLI